LSGIKSEMIVCDNPLDNYYLAFPGDRIYHKALVTVLFLMQAFQTMASLFDGFRWFGRDYGNMNALDQVGLAWFAFVLWESQSRQFI
jgi:hypothetical protein